jgi:hypothetical protein
MKSGKRIINIDETWINQTNFTWRHWQPVSGLPAYIEKVVTPRISLIAAICTYGTVNLSLTQVTTDSEVMSVYFTEFVKQLERFDLNWRDNSVILLDNAPYHVSKEFQEHLTWLRVPVIYSGYYSYLSAPCEMYFAHFKRG